MGADGRYNCYGARVNHGTERCITVSGLSIDAAIATEVLRVLKPLGMDAAVKAIEAQSNETTAAERQLELSLQQARYGPRGSSVPRDRSDLVNVKSGGSIHEQDHR